MRHLKKTIHFLQVLFKHRTIIRIFIMPTKEVNEKNENTFWHRWSSMQKYSQTQKNVSPKFSGEPKKLWEHKGAIEVATSHRAASQYASQGHKLLLFKGTVMWIPLHCADAHTALHLQVGPYSNKEGEVGGC